MPSTAKLPRRVLLGAWLAPDLEAFSGEGVLITGTVPGSMADAAGLRAGDRIVSLGGAPLRSMDEMRTALRCAGAQQEVELRFVRDGAAIARIVTVQRTPGESLAGHNVTCDHLEVDGVRLRTIETRPRAGAIEGCIFFIQGIACESVDQGATPDAPIARLIRDWAMGGYMTLRVDKRGVGDSEGESCAQLDFETELRGYRATFAHARELATRANVPLILFGHSVGGMVAPLLAAQHPVDRIIVYGTSARRWLDIMEDTTVRQRIMAGTSETGAAAEVGRLRERALSDGLNGRSPAYHRQLDELDLQAAWRDARCERVLVLRGEHDWVVTPEEQAEIAGVFPGAVDVMDVPGLDHLFGWHPDRGTSQRHYGGGSYGPEAAREMLAWLADTSGNLGA